MSVCKNLLGHMYSREMNQPRPRKCIWCEQSEPDEKESVEIDDFEVRVQEEAIVLLNSDENISSPDFIGGYLARAKHDREEINALGALLKNRQSEYLKAKEEIDRLKKMVIEAKPWVNAVRDSFFSLTQSKIDRWLEKTKEIK